MTWDKKQAKTEIRKYFLQHRASAKKATMSASDGKIYELYCLVETLHWLKLQYSATITFVGSTVDFKASPGNIDRFKSYFKITANGQKLELHTDIEVQTLGASMLGGSSDYSGYHEIDLVLIDPSVPNGQKPRYDQLFLGVECKSHANFSKGILKQVLGVRRELSLLHDAECELDLLFGSSPIPCIRALPASLYWLAFTDPKGLKYSQSPGAFAIDFKHWRP